VFSSRTCIRPAVADAGDGSVGELPIASRRECPERYFITRSCSAKGPWRPRLGRIYFRLAFLLLTLTGAANKSSTHTRLLEIQHCGTLDVIAFVGLRNAKLVVAQPAIFVGLGNFQIMKCRSRVRTDLTAVCWCAAWVAGFCLELSPRRCRHAERRESMAE